MRKDVLVLYKFWMQYGDGWLLTMPKLIELTIEIEVQKVICI